MITTLIGNPLRSIMVAAFVAALAFGGLQHFRYQRALQANEVLAARSVVLAASLVVAEQQAAQTKAAWQAGQTAIRSMQQSARELAELRANLLKGNFDAIPLDPALRAVLDSLRARRAGAATGRSQDGSP